MRFDGTAVIWQGQRQAAIAKLLGLAFLGLIAGFAVSRFVSSTPNGSVPGIPGLVVHAQPKPIPDVAFFDEKGVQRHLSEWRGRTVLLNLWATWCAPCKREMPALDKLQARLGGQAFTVLTVSTDRTGPKEPRAFLDKAGLAHLPLYNDDTAGIVPSLKAEGLPLTVIVNGAGLEMARLLGPADWNSEPAIAAVKTFYNEAASGS